ncbi:nuclear transport factor 2 family protein [Microlunatus spumicola]|uniref:Nuclear transport factor 2 family protein n=1 Tax=Microlunatus spumicola TaxID=81499 RepID=A0ABP6X8Q3_9ACTN
MSGVTFADWKSIKDLVDAYAHHADRRDPQAQADVFAEDGQVRLFQGDPSTHEPEQVITGRADLASTFDHLISQYDATTYLNGQSTITVDGDAASAESYCLAHHLTQEDGERVLIVMAIRYLDTFRRTDEGWRIARRDLVFDWTDRRPSRP